MSAIVIAPDSFKGSARAEEVAAAIARGWSSVRADDRVECYPMADGGEGTIDAVAAALPGAIRHHLPVEGPVSAIGTDFSDAEWLEFTDSSGQLVGLVELASASGLEKLHRLAPLTAHTFGFGRLIADALDAGVDRLLLALGGSASTDAGMGALIALGARVLDENGAPVPLGGGGLSRAVAVDFDAVRRAPSGGALVFSDVRAPLLGSGGAAAVFGPQKGATPEDVATLEGALARLAELVPADPSTPGAGAAGGAGFGLLAWGATITSGAEAVAESVGLDAAVAAADLVITGEGSFDGQTSDGKAPGVVLGLASRHGVPGAVVAGRIEARTEGAAVSLTELAGSGEESMRRPLHWLEQAGRALAEGFRQ